MKKLLYFSAIFLLISNCSLKKEPIFIKVDAIKVVSVATDTIKLEASALFENPNHIGGKIFADKVKVIVNDIELAHVFSKEFKIPANKEFSVPLHIKIPVNALLKNNKNGIIGGLINSFFNKSIKIRLKGEFKYKVLGFSKTYTIDKTENIKL